MEPSFTLTQCRHRKCLIQSMEVPVFQSSLTKDGIQSQFLFNDSEVNWGKLEGLMFGQIRVLQGFGNYYHLWAGFEDGSFLGYYDKGKNAKAKKTKKEKVWKEEVFIWKNQTF